MIQVNVLAKILVKGVVQGVGFRPFIWQLARQFGFVGHVLNNGEGVTIFIHQPVAEGDCQADSIEARLAPFLHAIAKHAPPLAQIDSITLGVLSSTEAQALLSATEFTIVSSQETVMNTSVLADSATCAACLEEIMDSNDRRYGYAFTNCTHCGPRYSIIKAMPYDRAATSMDDFAMCSACAGEYQDPSNRRFHAQPNACADCGPLLSFWVRAEPVNNQAWLNIKLSQQEMIQEAVLALKKGKVLAVKGVGGVHLVCDATHDQACQTLRLRKNRPYKPFALMAADCAAIAPYVQLSALGEQWLTSRQAPIVLLPLALAEAKVPLSDSVAPNQSRLGVMLPSNPLHHLLLRAWQAVSPAGLLVFTSANVSGAPQIYQDESALTDLRPLADAYLSHNRDIVRRLEDSVVSILPNFNSALVIRQARGFSPYRIPLPLGFDAHKKALAAGSDLKNSLALRKDNQLILSQYLGDLADFEVQQAYQETLASLPKLYQMRPDIVLHDAHPGYFSSQKITQNASLPTSDPLERPTNCPQWTAIQHHHAHFNACLLDNQIAKDTLPVMGIILDGLGYGEDGSLWGGEFLYGHYQAVKRVAHLNARPLLGGDTANKAPWRNAYAQLRECGFKAPMTTAHDKQPGLVALKKLAKKPLNLLEQAVNSGINCPLSTSAGRLFDAVAALCDICFERVTYEGQAAMELEALLDVERIEANRAYAYPLGLDRCEAVWQLTTQPLFKAILSDLEHQVSVADISARFHIGFAQSLIDSALSLRAKYPFTSLLLSGGVCQNGWLMHLIGQKLPTDISLLTHHNLPANDQSIALGQLLVEEREDSVLRPPSALRGKP